MRVPWIGLSIVNIRKALRARGGLIKKYIKFLLYQDYSLAVWSSQI